MAASTTAKLRSAPCLRYSTRVRSSPAWPTSERPGSSRSLTAREPSRVDQRAGVLGNGGRGLVAIADAEAAADVDVRRSHALRAQPVRQLERAFQRRDEGRELGDLRADMAADAGNRQVRQRAGAAVERQRVLVGHAELAFLEAGGDVGMGARVDVGIDAQADRRRPAASPPRRARAARARSPIRR